jgi:transposase
VRVGCSACVRNAQAVEGTVGRKALSPRRKLVLWLYAISEGVGSARAIARLVRSDDAYALFGAIASNLLQHAATRLA